jgi:hypothetical protein
MVASIVMGLPTAGTGTWVMDARIGASRNLD